MEKSTPNFEEFNPFLLPFQTAVIEDVYHNLDFSMGMHELLFSGTIGSSKSTLAAHLIIRHALDNHGARILIGRRSLPDLKDTLFQKIIEHLEGSRLIEGKHYIVRNNTAEVEFLFNNSIIIGKSWADKKYRKFRSLELSMAVIEEATENNGDDMKAISEIRQRIGRIRHIKQNLMIFCTNPDGPRHPIYKYFFIEKSPTKHIYLSKSKDNPFLTEWYIEQKRRELDPKEARRQIDGEWIEIDSERLYHSYSVEHNFIKAPYEINPTLPIAIAFDFNIGHGKPLSCAFGQYDKAKDRFHFFDEIVIEGARTLNLMEEAGHRGLLDHNVEYHIFGDATGEARSTNSIHSDYDIIRSFLNNFKRKDSTPLVYKMKVPRSNPPIRTRHNLVNSYCENSLGERRLFVYEKCKKLNEGMMLTALKKGAEYLEDDSKDYQHVTTAIGYFVVYQHNNKNIQPARNLA